MVAIERERLELQTAYNTTQCLDYYGYCNTHHVDEAKYYNIRYDRHEVRSGKSRGSVEHSYHGVHKSCCVMHRSLP